MWLVLLIPRAFTFLHCLGHSRRIEAIGDETGLPPIADLLPGLRAQGILGVLN
jgi:hypothetical protein